MGERQHLIGPVEHPIYVCKKKDISTLFDNDFHKVYDIWEMFHYTNQLPVGVTWDTMDPLMTKLLIEFEKYFDRYFSHDALQLKLLEGILKTNVPKGVM